MPEWFTRERMDGYVVSTDASRLDMDIIHGFLLQAYWSRGVPRDVVERSIANSLPFGLYSPSGAQVGFARVVTDRAVVAYLGDVFVLPEHRGRGLGVWLVESVMEHPDLQGLRRFSLATTDAHGLYARFGFGPPSNPEILMTIERSPHELWERPARVPSSGTS
jgi:GNAT superfamily N-acetyltransferase